MRTAVHQADARLMVHAQRSAAAGMLAAAAFGFHKLAGEALEE